MDRCSCGKHQKGLSNTALHPSHGLTSRQQRVVASRSGPQWLMAIQATSAGNLAANSKPMSITSCRNGGGQGHAHGATNTSSRTRRCGNTVQQNAPGKENKSKSSTITITVGRPEDKNQKPKRLEPTRGNRE